MLITIDQRSARTEVAVAAVYNNAIVVIGGCTKVSTIANRESSSLTDSHEENRKPIHSQYVEGIKH